VPGRIARVLEARSRSGRPAFLPYLPSGYPDPRESDALALALCDEGADVLELGVPFSDPLADGPVIQRATEIALAAGASLRGALAQAARIRSRARTPLVLMSYVNPVLRYGGEAFARDAAAAGVDGVLLVDLPPEEEAPLWDALRGAGLDTIVMVSPTTDPARLPGIVGRASGYVYVVARLGVTGAGGPDTGLEGVLERVRQATPLPRCLGFGFDPSSDLSRYRGLAEGIIVGSALLEPLLAAADAAERASRARSFARDVGRALDRAAPR
jgi:tryptophan synthase alpha chain